MNYLTQNTQDFDGAFSTVDNDINSFSSNTQAGAGGFVAFMLIFWLVIIAIAIIDVVLKVKAMWRAARLSDKGWFICLFLFNTAGILPFIYLRSNRERYRQLILKKHSD